MMICLIEEFTTLTNSLSLMSQAVHLLCASYTLLFGTSLNLSSQVKVQTILLIGVVRLSHCLQRFTSFTENLYLFIFVVFTALTKAPLASEGNPYIEESKHFHY